MTRKMYLIAGVAGLALTAPASAEKNGRGNDKSPQAAAAQDGGEQAKRPQRQERQEQAPRVERPQRAERQEMQRAERSQRVERQEVQRAERPQRAERMQRAERPQLQRAERQEQRIERQERRMERPAGVERKAQRIERKEQRVDRLEQRVDRREQRVDRQAQRIERRDDFRPQQVDRQQQRGERRLAEQMFAPRSADRGAVRTARFDGRGYRPVAPLFSTRAMRQMKPFKAKFDGSRIVSIGDRIDDTRSWSPVPTFYANNYVDTRDYYHRYDSDFGSVYRIDRNDGFVRSQYPLFGGYGIGDPWPQTYYSSYVPSGYRDYYYDTPDYYYRNDGYGIYQVDGSTQLITALVSLLMGQGYGVGQTLPASYGVYNVPLDYRASYQDNDDNYYRYGDGYIYQMDQGSRRIAARYPIYADDYDIGERWPVAYPDYNVPYGYSSAYQDTPQYQYRYANNGIYQVDPTNQMILALVALLSGDQFAVGQRMPSGYDTYNVPFDYRDRYADSDSDWYRYANGNVYRVDAGSGLIEESYPVYG